MKRLGVAFAISAALVALGSATAHAYPVSPPQPIPAEPSPAGQSQAGTATNQSADSDAPAINDPVEVAPGDVVTLAVINLQPGDAVKFTLDGATYSVVAGADGVALVAPGAPKELGTYPVTATLPDGTVLTTEVIVTNDANLPDSLGDTGSTIIAPAASFGGAALAAGVSLLLVSRRRRVAIR